MGSSHLNCGVYAEMTIRVLPRFPRCCLVSASSPVACHDSAQAMSYCFRGFGKRPMRAIVIEKCDGPDSLIREADRVIEADEATEKWSWMPEVGTSQLV